MMEVKENKIRLIDFFYWIVAFVLYAAFLYVSNSSRSFSYNTVALMLSAILVEIVRYFVPAFFKRGKAGKIALFLGIFSVPILLYLKNYVSVSTIEMPVNTCLILVVWISMIFLQKKVK